MFDRRSYFCDNPDCRLHVREGDSHVRGSGNWATLPEGIIVGRSRTGAFMLCDECRGRIHRGELVAPTIEA